jgi:hypothetical protein
MIENATLSVVEASNIVNTGDLLDTDITTFGVPNAGNVAIAQNVGTSLAFIQSLSISITDREVGGRTGTTGLGLKKRTRKREETPRAMGSPKCPSRTVRMGQYVKSGKERKREDLTCSSIQCTSRAGCRKMFPPIKVDKIASLTGT